MAAKPEIDRDNVGLASVVGVVAGVFAGLSVVWIPTLAVVFGIAAVVGGTIDHRGSSGWLRVVARLAIVLGLLAILATVAVVLFGFTTDPTSGTAVDVVGPPAS